MMSALSEGNFLQLSFCGKWVKKSCSRVGLKPMLPFFALLLILSVSLYRRCRDCGSSGLVYFSILLGVRCHHFACSTPQKEHEQVHCASLLLRDLVVLVDFLCGAMSVPITEKMVLCMIVYVATKSANYLRQCDGVVHHRFRVDVAPCTIFRCVCPPQKSVRRCNTALTLTPCMQDDFIDCV